MPRRRKVNGHTYHRITDSDINGDRRDITKYYLHMRSSLLGEAWWKIFGWLRSRRTSWWALGEDGIMQADGWRAVEDRDRRLLIVEQHQRGVRLFSIVGLVGRQRH